MQDLKRWIRRLAWSLAGIACLLLLVWWGLPVLLTAQLPAQLSQALGRPVAVDSVDIVPWQLAVTVKGLRIGAAGTGNAGTGNLGTGNAGTGSAGTADTAQAMRPLLDIAQLRVDMSLKSLRQRAPVTDAITIDGLRLNLVRTAPGHYDIDDLLTRFAPKPTDAQTAPARFALYNLALRDAQLRLDDRPVGRVHSLQDLTLTLPFLSNLPADIAIVTEPRLAFTVNGTRIDSGSQAQPFAATRNGELKLAFADLDLTPWLGYLPAGLPLQLQRARLTSDLQLRFALPPQGTPSVSLQGRFKLADVMLAEPDGAPLLHWQALALELRDVQPLARRVDLGLLALDGAELQLGRDARGRLNLQRLLAPADAARPDRSGAAAAAADAPAKATEPWQLRLAGLRINQARVRWNDDAVQPQAALQLDDLSLQADGLQWPAPAPLPLSLGAILRAQHDGAPPVGRFSLTGRANDQQAALTLALTDLDLAGLTPYLAQALTPRVTGLVSAQADLAWSRSADAPALTVTVAQAGVRDLQLREMAQAGKPAAGRTPTAARASTTPRQPALAAIGQLRVERATVDLLARRVTLGSVQIKQPALAVTRDAGGVLNLTRWAANSPAAAKTAAPAGAAAAGAARPWRISLQDLSLDGGALQWSDAQASTVDTGEAVRIDLSGLRLRLQQLSWPAAAGAGPTPTRLQLAARISAPGPDGMVGASANSQGSIDWTGRFGLAPLQAEGSLTLQRLPLHLLVPYAGTALPVSLLHADIGFQGRIRASQANAGWQVGTDGDLQVNELQVNTRPAAGQALDAGDELLSWQSLALQGVSLALAPPAAPQVAVREIALSDFYSRLTVTEQGRLNLQDVTAARPAGTAASAAAPAPAAQTAAAAPAPADSASAPAAAGLPITVALGPTQLRNGRIDFSDRFVQPNYSVRLTDLNGQIGALRSDSREMATISLRGRAAQTALIDIGGQINPTAQPLALDIRAQVTDLELAPFTPYAGKYAGYAIERGKLSMDVAYKIDADGKLAASNQVVLNQLTFGERVTSLNATQLPVLLAVALLKDSNGVIDVNLPVSGSVNDPQFSVGGIIWKVILNLLGKAVTAPFALLAGNDKDDLSLVEFSPGTALINPAGEQSLGKVAQALTQRPGLKMTVTGAADPASEREALQQVLLEQRLQAELTRERLRAGPAAAPAPAAAASAPPQPAAPAAALAPAERDRLLKTVYQQTTLPNKPRNALGLARDIAPAEMEALLRANIRVDDDSLRELALARGLAVRDALVARGLPSDRLFLARPTLRVAGTGTGTGTGAVDAAWTPSVQLSLSTH